MKIFIRLFILAPLLLSSCTSVMPEFDRLNPGEYATLVKRCTKIVERLPNTGKHPVSRRDKMFVKSHEPKFHAEYTGYKTGYFKASWKLGPSYIIMVEGRGKMTDEKCPIWVTVQRFDE
jgi:hypothetical protein